MSISNHDIIDAVAANENKLILLISDHLRWDNYQVAHLKMLQDKLNTYIRYIISSMDLNKQNELLVYG